MKITLQNGLVLDIRIQHTKVRSFSTKGLSANQIKRLPKRTTMVTINKVLPNGCFAFVSSNEISCSPFDQFQRRYGTSKALNKAMEHASSLLNLSKDDRAQIYNTIWNRGNNQSKIAKENIESLLKFTESFDSIYDSISKISKSDWETIRKNLARKNKVSN